MGGGYRCRRIIFISGLTLWKLDRVERSPAEVAMHNVCSVLLRGVSFLFVLLLASPLRAQVCSGNVGLYAQAEVDVFDCSEVTGDLTIAGADITDLTPLADLATVGGRLAVTETDALATLEGLGGVTSIGATLYLGENSALTSLEGLDALASIGEDIYVASNGALTSFEGLNSLVAIGGSLRIGGSSTLESLAGLDALASIGGNLRISDNSALMSLHGLDALTSVGGSIYINSNSALTSLTGLGALASVGDYFQVSRNDALTSIAGLGNLADVGTYLSIGNNDLLTSLEGLDALTSVGGYLSVRSNIELSDCACNLLGLISGDPPAFTGVTFSTNFVNNAPGSHCNDRDDVLAASLACMPVASEPTLDAASVSLLYESFPNPFRPEAGPLTIRFRKGETDDVHLAVYDLRGRAIVQLVDAERGIGTYTVEWKGDGADGQVLSAGTYLLVMEAGNSRQSRLITVVR